jgi:uncharacterized membrane protein
MAAQPLAVAATEERLDALRRAGVLTDATHARAIALALGTPDADAWRRFAAKASLALGAACALAGLVFFIAWNWDGLPRFAQFAALEALMVAAAYLSTRAPDTFARQMALTFAAVVIGPLLAAYGQAYQTGADPYELFLTWALLAAPLAAVARFTPLWMVIAVLLNVTLGLFCEQVRPFGPYPWDYSGALLAALNAVLWVAYEVWRGKKGRWPARVLAMWAGLAALPMAIDFACGYHFLDESAGMWSLVACLAISAGAALVYRGKRLDLFMLSLACFCVSFIGASFLWRFLRPAAWSLDWYDDAWHLAHVAEGVFFVAAAAVSVGWIRRCRKEATA